MIIATDIKIRTAKPEEAETISLLIFNSFIDKKNYYTEEAFAYTTPLPDIIEQRINNKMVWVISSDNEISATVSGLRLQENFHIRSMAVKKEARRNGLAKALMTYMEEIALKKGCKNLMLTTTSFLIPAVRLYESLDFRITDNKDLYGTTLIEMTKKLTPKK